MFQFSIRFFICNIFIAGVICFFLCLKRLLSNRIPARTQFRLWFLILGLMVVPFIPFHLPKVWQVFQLLKILNSKSETGLSNVGRFDPSMSHNNTLGWTNDFAISVSRDVPNLFGFLICSIWITGIIAMILLTIRSRYKLGQLKKSALPLQNKVVLSIFQECKTALSVTRNIPIYSTVFLKSPITVGILHPQVYIPIHLISDFQEKDMRYILLHELQHFKYKDAIPNHIMNLAAILYWFNPAVWYAFKEMRSDREVACDSAVLHELTENDYESYGNTLINFAEKLSLSPFPFTSGLGGSVSQIKKRIINIASYQPLTKKKKFRGLCVYGTIAAIIIGLVPFLSTYAAEHEYYHFSETDRQICYVDFSSYFENCNGAFVLYDAANDTWQIYNKDLATMRVAPNSTYKIYEGLIGLDYDVINPDKTELAWDGTNQPFTTWNDDQDLSSAMHDSVNWYFESIGNSVGFEHIQDYLQQINYGNQNISAGETYWMESSLKISPIEQVELLKRFNTNQLSSSTENTSAVKNAIRLSSSPNQSLYGKTGTGRVNGQDINGWFIGYIETQNQIYYFATNIQNSENATGGKAVEITQAILSDMNIWK